jgi:hypothetical protein
MKSLFYCITASSCKQTKVLTAFFAILPKKSRREEKIHPNPLTKMGQNAIARGRFCIIRLWKKLILRNEKKKNPNNDCKKSVLDLIFWVFPA